MNIILTDENFKEKSSYITEKGIVFIFNKINDTKQANGIRKFRTAMGMTLIKEDESTETWLCPNE